MQKLLSVLKEINEEIDYENSNALIDNHLLNSFDIIQIVVALNEAYDIRIPASEIVPANFNSAQALYAMVQRLLSEKE
jgi:acyl carrier protein